MCHEILVIQRKAIAYRSQWTQSTIDYKYYGSKISLFDVEQIEEFRELVPRDDECLILLFDRNSKVTWNSKYVSDVFVFSEVQLNSFTQILGRARRIDSHPSAPNDYPIRVYCDLKKSEEYSEIINILKNIKN